MAPRWASVGLEPRPYAGCYTRTAAGISLVPQEPPGRRSPGPSAGSCPTGPSGPGAGAMVAEIAAMPGPDEVAARIVRLA